MAFLLFIVSLVFATKFNIMQYDRNDKVTRYLTTIGSGYVRLVTEKDLADNPKLSKTFSISSNMSKATITHDGVGLSKDLYGPAISHYPLSDSRPEFNWNIIKKGANLYMLKTPSGLCAKNIEIPYNNVVGLCLQVRSCDENDPTQLFEIKPEVTDQVLPNVHLPLRRPLHHHHHHHHHHLMRSPCPFIEYEYVSRRHLPDDTKYYSRILRGEYSDY